MTILNEARREKKEYGINLDGDKMTTIEYLKSKYLNEKYFVSFTEDLTPTHNGKKPNTATKFSGSKIGINPKSQFDTPIGVYCYPVAEVVNNPRLGTYAVDKKIVQIIEANFSIGHINDLAKYTSFDADYQKAIDMFGLGEEDLVEITNMAKKHPTFSIATNDQPYLFWAMTLYVSLRSSNMLSQLNYVGNTLNLSGKHISKWNAVIRRLGYHWIADRSALGIIHKNEPAQAVFLDNQSYSQVEVYENKGFEYVNNAESIKKLVASNKPELADSVFLQMQISTNDYLNIYFQLLRNNSSLRIPQNCLDRIVNTINSVDGRSILSALQTIYAESGDDNIVEAIHEIYKIHGFVLAKEIYDTIIGNSTPNIKNLQDLINHNKISKNKIQYDEAGLTTPLDSYSLDNLYNSDPNSAYLAKTYPYYVLLRQGKYTESAKLALETRSTPDHDNRGPEAKIINSTMQSLLFDFNTDIPQEIYDEMLVLVLGADESVYLYNKKELKNADGSKVPLSDINAFSKLVLGLKYIIDGGYEEYLNSKSYDEFYNKIYTITSDIIRSSKADAYMEYIKLLYGFMKDKKIKTITYAMNSIYEYLLSKGIVKDILNDLTITVDMAKYLSDVPLDAVRNTSTEGATYIYMVNKNVKLSDLLDILGDNIFKHTVLGVANALMMPLRVIYKNGNLDEFNDLAYDPTYDMFSNRFTDAYNKLVDQEYDFESAIDNFGDFFHERGYVFDRNFIKTAKELLIPNREVNESIKHDPNNPTDVLIAKSKISRTMEDYEISSIIDRIVNRSGVIFSDTLLEWMDSYLGTRASTAISEVYRKYSHKLKFSDKYYHTLITRSRANANNSEYFYDMVIKRKDRNLYHHIFDIYSAKKYVYLSDMYPQLKLFTKLINIDAEVPEVVKHVVLDVMSMYEIREDELEDDFDNNYGFRSNKEFLLTYKNKNLKLYVDQFIDFYAGIMGYIRNLNAILANNEYEKIDNFKEEMLNIDMRAYYLCRQLVVIAKTYNQYIPDVIMTKVHEFYELFESVEGFGSRIHRLFGHMSRYAHEGYVDEEYNKEHDIVVDDTIQQH